jgi:hypothetical protein
MIDIALEYSFLKLLYLLLYPNLLFLRDRNRNKDFKVRSGLETAPP